MKGLSVLFTLALLVLAHQLSAYLKRAGQWREPMTPGPRLLAQGPEFYPHTRTNSRGFGLRPARRSGAPRDGFAGLAAEAYANLEF